MTSPITHPIDPDLDLVLERAIDAPPSLVWSAWTRPEHIKKWFTPAPWTTEECEIDLRPGGSFRTVRRGPAGEESITTGCFLEVVENEKLVWTIALLPGYRPASVASEIPLFTAIITLVLDGEGTRYRVVAAHQDREGRNRHEAMGFHEGWGTVHDQMIAILKTL